jgi:glutathione S-transferase
MTEAMMKLLGFPGSPNTWKILAFAREIDLPLDLEIVDLAKGAQRHVAYLARNPTGRTPTLVDGDFTLWESTAILQYLGDRKKSALWPEDRRIRADIMRWQSWQLQHWGAAACEPLLFERVVKPFFNLGPADAAAVAKAESAFRTEATVLDAHLAKHRFLVDDTLTLAEFSVAPYLQFAGMCGIPIAEFKNVERWFGEVAGRPSWQASVPRFA